MLLIFVLETGIFGHPLHTASGDKDFPGLGNVFAQLTGGVNGGAEVIRALILDQQNPPVIDAGGDVDIKIIRGHQVHGIKGNVERNG